MFKKILHIFSNNSKVELSNQIKGQEPGKIEINHSIGHNNGSPSEKIILTEDEINDFIEQEIAERTKTDHNPLEKDNLFEKAAEIVVIAQQCSISILQKKLVLEYDRAGRIVDQLEFSGIVGGFNGSKPREVLIPELVTLDTHLNTNKRYKNKKQQYFDENIFPSKLELIESEVKKYFESVRRKQEDGIRESLKQEILEKEEQRLKKEKIKNLKRELMQEMTEQGIIRNNSILKREPISQEVQDKVWNRDGGKCIKCESQEKLEFDHIIPFSKGGSNSYRNLQLLCEKCNRQKSNKIG